MWPLLSMLLLALSPVLYQSHEAPHSFSNSLCCFRPWEFAHAVPPTPCVECLFSLCHLESSSHPLSVSENLSLRPQELPTLFNPVARVSPSRRHFSYRAVLKSFACVLGSSCPPSELFGQGLGLMPFCFELFSRRES